jgi:hypothetical protein
MLRSRWSPAAILLVVLMGVGSVLMWLALPAFLVWVASKASKSSQITFASVLIVVIGLPLGMAVIGRALGSLDRVYARLRGTADERPRQPAWLRSMRGERGSTRRGGVLDRVMVISVALALALFAVWFFGFAGSSLPTG